jgi:signal transduction histidine kinase
VSREPEDQRTAELIATVAHEIRSPLTSIKGFTKTLIDRWERLSDEMKLEMLQAVNTDADRVTRILSELLDVSRLEAGRLPLHLRPADLRELASEVVKELEERSDEHTVELVGKGPVDVKADPDKVRRVLVNFIENAQKYTEGGRIEVACFEAGGWAQLTVTDSGSGVAEELRDILFEKFSRREVPGMPSGTGLGLYICKGLIEAHGGEIGMDPAPSGGSSFWFRLPL